MDKRWSAVGYSLLDYVSEHYPVPWQVYLLAQPIKRVEGEVTLHQSNGASNCFYAVTRGRVIPCYGCGSDRLMATLADPERMEAMLACAEEIRYILHHSVTGR
jgi:hypothetical protein